MPHIGSAEIPVRANLIPCSDQIVAIFNGLFVSSLQTCLCGGGDEPIYLPAGATEPLHRIVFTRDYVASALHEIAHWCVAGPARRLLPDFGYWYNPDGRTVAQQQEFERAEVKPQALEWIFSSACGISFRVSADNLTTGLGASVEFKSAIVEQAQYYCRVGAPSRAQQLIQAFASFYGVTSVLDPARYRCDALN